jgi:putative two-component system response regulator
MDTPLRVLIVEDSEDDTLLLVWTLRRGGYDPMFERVETAAAMKAALDQRAWDIVISDYFMPHFNGLAALMLLKESGLDLPFIIVSGAIGEEAAVEAMKAGAHDYVMKGKLARLAPAIKRELQDATVRRERNRVAEELQDSLKKLRRALGGAIQAIALTVEARDPYTAGHQRRVADLARALATEMGLPKERTEGIRLAGVIHDIGKVAVPAEILSKPGQINNIEFGLIKTHSRVGYDILKTIEFPWPVAQIVLQHHERMNGSGYPQGLSDGEILLEAKVLAVADVVEAMASHRPYRPAQGIDKALEEISQNRGILYDSEVVGACLKLITEKGFALR